MKRLKHILILLFFIGLSSCNKDEVDETFLPNIRVNEEINMRLAQYSDLQISGGVAINESAGIRGIVIYNTGTGYIALDLACPHKALQACSTMTVDVPFLICSCDGEKFSILDGAPQNGSIRYPARAYIVRQSGDILFITN